MLVLVQEALAVLGALVPPSSNEQPAAFGQGPVRFLPSADVVDIEEKVGVGSGFGAHVEDESRANEPGGFDLGDVFAATPGDPVHGCVHVGADVFAGVDVVMLPERAWAVVCGNLLKAEVNKVCEGLRQVQSGSVP